MINKNTILAFFSGCFWGWGMFIIKRAELISGIELSFLWISGCVFIGIVSAYVCLENRGKK